MTNAGDVPRPRLRGVDDSSSEDNPDVPRGRLLARRQRLRGVDDSSDGSERDKSRGWASGKRRRWKETSETSKRFTPKKIDRSKCLARTWNKGYGGQCDSKPIANKVLCKDHTVRLTHGYVTGSVPFKKLEAFLREECKR